MPPKTTKNKSTPQDPDGIFAGMAVFLVQHGVQPRRLQVLTPSTFVLCFQYIITQNLVTVPRCSTLASPIIF